MSELDLHVKAYFDTDEAYQKVQNLQGKIQDLKEDIKNYNPNLGIEGLEDLKKQLGDAVEEFTELQNAGLRAANELGPITGQKIADVSKKFYDLRAELKSGEEQLEYVKGKAQQARDALNAALASNDPKKINDATEAWEKANNTLVILTTKVSELRGKTEESRRELEKLKNQSVFEELSGGADNYTGVLSGIPESIKKVIRVTDDMLTGAKRGIEFVGKGFIAFGKGLVHPVKSVKTLGVIIKRAFTVGPLMLVVGALQLFQSWTERSAKGQKALSVIMGYVSAIMETISDIGIRLMDTLYDMFAMPTKSGKHFVSLLKDSVLSTVKALIGNFTSLGKIIGDIFSGDFDAIGGHVDEWKKKWADAGDAIKDAASEAGNAWNTLKKSASKNFDGFNLSLGTLDKKGTTGARANLSKRTLAYDEAMSQEERVGLEGVMAQNLLIMRDKTKSAKERKDAIAEYKKALDKITEIDVKFAKRRAKIVSDQNSISTTNLEGLALEAQTNASAEAAEFRKYRRLRPVMMAENSIAKEEKNKKSAIKALENLYKLEEKQSENQRKLLRQSQDMELEQRERYIETIADAGEKEQEERKLAHDKTMLQIEREAEDKQRAILQMAKAEWSLDPKRKEKKFDIKEYFVGNTSAMEMSSAIESAKTEKQKMANRSFYSGIGTDYTPESAKKDEERKKRLTDIAMLEEGITKEKQKGISADHDLVRMLEQRLARAKRVDAAEQMQSYYEYLKEYGTYEQKKLAITKEYEQKIAEEQDPNKRASLTQGLKNALSGLDMEQMKNSLNWDIVFSDLSNYSNDFLHNLETQLKKALDVSDVTAEQAKIIMDKIHEIRKTISENEGSLISSLFGSNGLMSGSSFGKVFQTLAKQNSLESKSSSDKAAFDRLQEISIVSGARRDAQVIAFKQALKEAGISKFDNETNLVNNEEVVKAIGDNPELRNAYEQLVKASTEASQAANAASKAGAQASASNASAQGGQGASGFAITDAIIHGVNQNVQSLSTMVKDWKIGSQSFQKSVGKFAESSGYATAAFDSMKNGDIFGIIYNLGNAFNTLGESFGLWSNSNVQETEEQRNKLAKSNEVLSKAINDLRGTIQNSSLYGATKQFDQMIELQKLQEQQAKESLKALAGEYDDSHSTNYYSGGAALQFANIYNSLVSEGKIKGTAIGNPGDISNFLNQVSADDLAAMRKYRAQEFSAAQSSLRNADKNGFGVADEFGKFIDEFSGSLEQLELGWKETVTGMSFDSLKSNWISNLSDMNKGLDDWANDLNSDLLKSVTQFLNTKYFDGDSGKMSQWYNRFYEAMKNDNLNAEEIADLRKEYNTIAKEAMVERDALFSELGLGDVSNSEASGSVNSAKEMNNDTGNELVGRTTAVQLATERIAAQDMAVYSAESAILTSMQTTMDAYLAATMEAQATNVGILASIQDILATSYIELMGIRENTGEVVIPIKTIAKEMTAMREKIDTF